MNKKPSLSIFFPIYNDEGTVATMIVKSIRVAKELTDDYEIIVVDDCSIDKGGEVADELAKKYPKVKVIHHKKNEGYGGALKSGFNAARKEIIFYTDGDAQYDVFELKKLLPLMKNGIGMVNGFKIKRSDPFYRVILGKLYNRGVKMMFNIKIKDVDCDFRLIRKNVFDKINLKSNTGLICVEMVKKIEAAGFKTAEVGVSHYFRFHGKSQFFNFKRVFMVLIGLIGLWYQLVLKKFILGKVLNN